MKIMKLTKKELNTFKHIYEGYVGKKISDEKSEEIFVYFIRLMSSLKN
jgi:hypothetical protein